MAELSRFCRALLKIALESQLVLCFKRLKASLRARNDKDESHVKERNKNVALCVFIVMPELQRHSHPVPHINVIHVFRNGC